METQQPFTVMPFLPVTINAAIEYRLEEAENEVWRMQANNTDKYDIGQLADIESAKAYLEGVQLILDLIGWKKELI